MTKKYVPVPDVKRQLLIQLIYEKGMNISQAAKAADIYYPTAKAINKIYQKQNRTNKKIHRERSKKKPKFLDAMPQPECLPYRFLPGTAAYPNLDNFGPQAWAAPEVTLLTKYAGLQGDFSVPGALGRVGASLQDPFLAK